jgi:hypothetical protein
MENGNRSPSSGPERIKQEYASALGGFQGAMPHDPGRRPSLEDFLPSLNYLPPWYNDGVQESRLASGLTAGPPGRNYPRLGVAGQLATE